jgi:uncharacterized protein
MKIFVVLALVLAGVWLFRLNRRGAGQKPVRPGKEAATPALDMVRCRQCDTHLPKSDAVAGRQGIYCSPEHRQQAEH